MDTELLQAAEMLILISFHLLLTQMSQKNYKTRKHE